MDYKLQIYKEVARTKSFTKAAKALHLSQPAVSKTIKTLEEDYQRAFFIRQGNHIELTQEGQTFLDYTEQILQLYKQAENSLKPGHQDLPDQLVIAASTTVANYIIAGLVAKLQKRNTALTINLTTGNTEDIQAKILSNDLDFGIVEGKNQNSRLSYKKFLEDELVLVTRAQNDSLPQTITVDKLKSLTFVIREYGSGTRQVIEKALANRGIEERQTRAVLGSTEGIKSYLYQSNHFAFLSIHAVRHDLFENRLRLIDIEGLQIERWFYMITRQGFSSHIAETLGHRLKKAYNQE